jgi:hypothetical protein
VQTLRRSREDARAGSHEPTLQTVRDSWEEEGAQGGPCCAYFPSPGAGSRRWPAPGTLAKGILRPGREDLRLGSLALPLPSPFPFPGQGPPSHLPGGARVPQRAPRAGSVAPSRQLGQHFALTLARALEKLCGSAGTGTGRGGPGLREGGQHDPPPPQPKRRKAGEGEERRPRDAAPSPRPPQLLSLPDKLLRIPGLPARPSAWPPGAGSPAEPRARAPPPRPPPPAPAARRQGLYFLRRARLDLAGPRQSCASARC